MKVVFEVLNYASKRAQNTQYIQTDATLLQDLLGAPDEHDQATLNLAHTQFQGAIDTTGQRQPPDRGVLIFCSDDHLTYPEDGFRGVYFDNGDNRQAQVRAKPPVPGATGPCKGNLRAFVYPFGFKDGSQPGGTAVVLCSNWDGGAITSTKDVKGEIGDWRKGGDLRRYSQGIETVGQYLSYMIIHELMHVANLQQCPAALPDGNIGEVYGYEKIAGHAPGATGGSPPSVNNRQHNADSFAFLASAWYLNLYKWTNGAAVLTKKAERPPNEL
ncbi:uncharacterized protein J4E79_003288 [Alternaria viburni]|uniref:uncharacterized protein n=1 Tax=Alternaria viburni TaxID=566460 RepID=UPI0020C342F9|nr:uncharacterized protein J4E79_003288 [Alternaria viburni]KAI4664989.1 hypothetical protein J4E79_003288 [Alternaria viburni]